METPKRTKPSTPVYAVYASSSPRIVYTNSVKEARTLCSTPEFRENGGRFRTFKTEEEGEEFFSKNPISEVSTPVAKRGEDGYRSPHPKLRPQEHSTFMKMIQNLQNDQVLEFMNENPHHFIEMSIDQPSILHAGFRYNALHMCCRFDNFFIAMEIMKRVKDFKYIAEIYKISTNIQETSDILVDRFLNNFDKAGRSPLVWAARNGYTKLVMFLTSFPEIQLPNATAVKDIQRHLKDTGTSREKSDRIMDAIRHPSKSYCVTLYKERNDEDKPFIAITSRFPHAVVPANQKQSYFKTIPCSAFTGRTEDGTTSLRVCKLLDSKHLFHGYDEDDGIGGSLSCFVPYASIGIFGEKWIAATFFLLWSTEFKRTSPATIGDPANFRDHLTNFAVRLADFNDYFVFFANMSGMVIPRRKLAQFKHKLLPETSTKDAKEEEEDLGMELHKAMQKLSVNDIKSRMIYNFDEVNEDDSEDNTFSTAPSSPIS